jgi:adenylate cyclase
LASERVERKLAAILAGDIAGYSRLMAANEEATLQRFNAHRREFLEPKIAEHRGRIVNWVGDGVLIEFVSALDATRCAIEIQRGMADRNANTQPDQRLELRIGVHVGEILIQSGDIFGDGVNIAARLEGIAAVGGICLSDDAYRQVRGKLEAVVEDGGEQELKNIARPIRVYRVRTGAEMRPTALIRPNKPSIAVLAFRNMSGDPKQEFFADGIAEEIITTLSKFNWLFVIARSSSFTYKDKPADVRQIGRELGVRYVLEGSVRKSAKRVRISAQLVDTSDGRHVWAERYDRAQEDIFAIQDEMTHHIVGAIAPGIVAAEIRRTLGKQAAELGQWERLMRAHWHVNRKTRDDNEEAIPLLEEIVRNEPNNALALTDLAHAWLNGALFGWSQVPVPVARQASLQYARRAVTADDQDGLAHAMLAICEAFAGLPLDGAMQRIQRALELDPNSSFAYMTLGLIHAWNGGEYKAAIEAFHEAMRLSPRDFLTVAFHVGIAWAYLSAGKFEEAAESATNAIEANPSYPISHAAYAATCAHLGRTAEAKAALAEFMRLQPGVTLRDERAKRPFRLAIDQERWRLGLRMAGLPE